MQLIVSYPAATFCLQQKVVRGGLFDLDCSFFHNLAFKLHLSIASCFLTQNPDATTSRRKCAAWLKLNGSWQMPQNISTSLLSSILLFASPERSRFHCDCIKQEIYRNMPMEQARATILWRRAIVAFELQFLSCLASWQCIHTSQIAIPLCHRKKSE